MTNRFRESKGLYLNEFSNQIEVFCPKCNNRGQIRRHQEEDDWFRKFICTYCSFRCDTSNPFWFSTSTGNAQCRCEHCSTLLKQRFSSSGKLPNSALLKCGECGKTTQANINWYPEPSSLAIDPFFGMTLYLQKECGQHVLWAYNQDHLKLLAAYVEASIRERMPNINASLISRLPAWIKSGKKRNTILRAIHSLQDLLR